MAETQAEMLGSCISAPLMSGRKDETGKDLPPQFVIEAYASDKEMIFDGADNFLLETMMKYAGPAHEAVELQYGQRQVARLPVMLLEVQSLAGFVESLRAMLCEACSAQDCEIFLLEEELQPTSKEGDVKLYIAEDREKSVALDEVMAKAVELGKIMAKIAPKKFIDMSKGFASMVAKRAISGKFATHVCNEPKKKPEGFDKDIDSNGAVPRSVMTAPIVEMGANPRLVGVVQLRTRIWHGDGVDAQNERCHGFCDKDAKFLEYLMTPMCTAIVASQRKEEYRMRRIDAMMAEKRAHAIMTVTNLAGNAKVVDDLSHLFTVVVQEIVQLLNCDRATFWRVGTGGEATLWTMVQPFPPTEGAAMIRIEVPMKEGTIAGSCVHNEKTINIADVYKDERFDQRFDKKTGYRTRSMLAIPIQDKRTQNIMGCLQCMNKENAEGESEGVFFAPDDESLGQAFANILAVALEQQSSQGKAAAAVDMVVKNLA